TLQNLFGSLDFCECDECRSVIGPAAYLVDLLEDLDPRAKMLVPDPQDPSKTIVAPINPRSGTTPIEMLLRRRPDLRHIRLTCENTKTHIPYIDLVNEILETWIAAQALPPSPGGPLPVETAGYNDTGGAAEDELRAFPQYIADQPAGAPDNR